jgi:hypothetical protein
MADNQRAGAALLLLVLGLVVGGTYAEHHENHGDYVDHHAHGESGRKADYESLTERLDKVTYRLGHLDEELDKRFDVKMKRRAGSLQNRLELIEGAKCDRTHYDCRGRDHECVSRLVVCDGRPDCRNGEDEKHCRVPLKIGDTFVGRVVFDKCTQRMAETVSFSISAVKHRPAFTPIELMRADIHIAKSGKDADLDLSLPTVGYYRLATENLVLMPPEDDGLGLICDFDGHDPDTCVGNIMHIASLRTCARFIFKREHH